MDEKFRDIGWYMYFATPRHTAFKVLKSIRFYQFVRKKELTYEGNELSDTLGIVLIGLLNVLINKAADFVRLSYRLSCFLFDRIPLASCRSPPIQELFQKKS